MKPVKPLKRKNTGFTLIEALIASMLIGLAIAALVSSSGAFTMYNAAGLDLSTSEFLIEEIRELTAPMPATEGTTFGLDTGEVSLALYDDVDDFRNRTYKPPIGVDRVAMTEFAAYSQRISVDKVNSADLTQTLASTATSDFYRVTVTILKNEQTITSASWIRAKY
jgi:type II secretory pathway pseudopilin PulG